MIARLPQLLIEALEDRAVPATFTWDDGGADNNWSTANNWAANVAPTAADTGVIIVFNTTDGSTIQNIVGLDIDQVRFDTGADITLTLNQDLTLNDLNASINIVDETGLNSITGTGNLVFSGGQMDIDTNAAAGSLVLAVDISGAFGFVKGGVGVLELAPPTGNNYTGTTSVDSGTLLLNSNTADAALSSTIVIGDGAGAADSAVLQLGANNFEIPDGATITINSDGRVNVPAGTTEDVTTLNVNGGQLNIAATGIFEIQPGGMVTSDGTAGSVIDGTGNLQSQSGSITFNIADGAGATDLRVTTPLTQQSAANLVKTGAGTLEFTMQSANALTGTTAINNGVLLLNTNTTDAALAGTITVGDSAGAAGSAVLRLMTSFEIADAASITVNSDGLLDVTATATEDVTTLTLTGGGGFAIATGGVFRIRPAGTANLTGGVLTFNRTGPAVPVGTTVTLIDSLAAGNPITGTFAGLPQGGMLTANGQSFSISYTGGTTGNDVVLTPVAPNKALGVSGQANGSAAVFLPNGAGQYAAAPTATLTPFAGFAGNVRTATADINGDGTADTILVTGPGGPVRVAVISGVDNTTVLVAPFDPFGDPAFTGGGFLSAGDTNNDGKAEFIVTPDQGGGPRVTIFTRNADATTTRLANFLGIDDATFRGGARSALGDVNKDGTLDLVVCAGFLGGPRTALFNGTTILGATPTRLINDFFAFPGADAVTLRNGVFVAAGDINGDGFSDLIFGGGPGGAPRVFILSGALVSANNVAGAQAAPVANFFVAGNATDRGGVRLATKNADGDSKADLIVGSGEGSPAKSRIYLGANFTGSGEPATFQDLTVFGGGALPGGVFVG